MIGWMLFLTLLIIVVGAMQDMQSGFGRAFGWPAPMFPWEIVIPTIVLFWAIYLSNRFGVIKFWFQI